jgi:hypothetical protein
MGNSNVVGKEQLYKHWSMSVSHRPSANVKQDKGNTSVHLLMRFPTNRAVKTA